MTELRPTLTLWMILGLMMPFFLAAQNLERCSYGEKMEQAFALDPAYKKAVLTEDWSATPAYQNKSSQSIITIPVHVIIVHPPGQAVGAGVNFSLAHVESQIQVLTDDFRRMNADAINTPTVFPAGDSEIEFCLATVDPNGNPTDGITRYATNQNLNSDELAIKTATGWDRNTYLNFWVGPNLGSLLGWAYLPTTTTLPDPTLDGIVVVSCSFGGPGFGTCAPYDLGRTGTHEVGHYLGLRHVWGAGGCSSDDGIADTPIQSGANFGCPNHPSPTCNNGGDMFMNYMDYVHDDCMNAFTVGQGTRMNNILNTSRSSLLGAAGIVCNSAVPLTLNLLNQTNVSCFAGNDGSISVEAIGGSGAYTYSINGGTPQNSGVFLNLTAGTYTVAVNDGSSSLAIQVTITAPAQLVPFVVNQTPTTCAGNGDGTLILGASGGTNLSGQGYQFNFNGNGFSSNNVFTNLSGGLYTVEVKDDNDCTESLQVIINEPNPLVSFLVNQVAIDCAGNNNGSVEVQSTGGTPIYSYALNGSGFDPNPVFSNLTAGSYFLQTVDASGCENTLNFTMTEPDTLMVALVSQVNLACFGDTNGSVEVSVTGGVGNFEFSLGNATNTTGIFENLSAGNYMLTATDANGCEDNMTFTILSPPEIFLEMIEMENVTCAGIANGSVEIQATGGVGNFEFSLGNATNTTGIFENLSAGNYTLTATDANGCQDNMAFTISSPAEISLEMLEMENVTCAGIANGSVEIQATGGVGNFEFSLGNETNVTGIFENLSAGNYTLTVTDANGCEYNMTFTISSPSEISLEIVEVENVTCAGIANGFVEIQATGGVGNFEFSLDNATNTTGIFENLSAGNYTLTVTDGNGCENNITFTISSPPEISLEMIEMENVTCAGIANGFIEIQATGGVGNLEFSLGNETNTTGIFENLSAGNYTLTATDANGCENNMTFTISSPSEISLEIIEVENVTCAGGTNGSVEIQAMGGAGNFEFSLGNATNTTGIFENLSAGNYTLTVTDANDCSTEMMIEIAEPSAIIFENVQVQDLDCFGAQNGQIEIIAGGGTGMLTFSLNNQTNTTGTFANLTAGNYEVVITDENGCTTIEPISVTQPPLLESSIDNIINDSGNADGSATINGVGGTPPLTYALDGVNFQTENTFNNLAAGTYTGYIQDANGCISTAAFVIDLETSANDLRLGVMNAEVFPNPFSSDLYLRVELAFSQSFDLKMWTVSGKQVVWQALHLEKGSHQIEISIQNQLPPGIYILELKNKLGGAGYFKLVKQ